MYTRIKNFLSRTTPTTDNKAQEQVIQFSHEESETAYSIQEGSEKNNNDTHCSDLEKVADYPGPTEEENPQLMSQHENTDDNDTNLKTAERIKLDGIKAVLTQVGIGFMRDFTWGASTWAKMDFFNGKLGDFFGPTLTQAAYAFPVTFGTAILTSSIGASSLAFQENKREWIKKQFTFAFASWSAIPVWNAAQVAGSWFGKEELGLSETEAGYFSSAFTGPAETAWQGILIWLFKQPIEVLEAVLYSLGGGVWQLIYQANLELNKDTFFNATAVPQTGGADKAFEVGGEIALGVALSTLAMTLLALEIKKRRAAVSSEPELAPNEKTLLNAKIYDKNNRATLFQTTLVRETQSELNNDGIKTLRV